MKTWIDDDGSKERARRETREMHDDFGGGIREGLRGCAEKVSHRAVGEYLKGPKPHHLRSRVGGATGFPDPSGRRENKGGRLGRSLMLGGSMSGGGFGSLMAGKGGDTILEFRAEGRDDVALEFGTRVWYGWLWEYGDESRTIVPRTKKVLRFQLDNGQWRSAKEIRFAPGTKTGSGRRPFLAPALDDEEPSFPNIIEAAVYEVIKRHGAA